MALIKVKAAKPEEVALWEKNPKHPEGEAYVAGDNVVEVADTPDVLKKLASGVLIKVEDSPESSADRSAKGEGKPSKPPGKPAEGKGEKTEKDPKADKD